MSTSSHTHRSLFHRIGAAGPARSRAFRGIAAPRVRRLAPRLLVPPVLLLAFTAPATSAAAPAAPPACELPLSAPPAVSGCVVAGEGEGAGQVFRPEGVAVDQETGTVYVADTNNKRVDEFSQQGGFVQAFGEGVNNGAEEPQTCTTSCRQGGRGGGAGEFNFGPDNVAVDNSFGGSEGDVYVTDDANFRVQKFTEDGEFVLMFGKEVNKTAVKDHGSEVEQNVCTKADLKAGDECGAGVLGDGPGEISNTGAPVAVDGAGHVWVGDLGRVEEFSLEGQFISELKLPHTYLLSTLAFDTDPFSLSDGDFYASDTAQNEIVRVKLPPGGSYTLSFEGQKTEVLSSRETTGAQVQAALERLSAIGPGNVSAQRSGEEVIVEFTGALGGKVVAPLSVSPGSVEVQHIGASGHLVKYEPDGEPVATIDEGGHPAALGMDPATGDVFVSDQLEPSNTYPNPVTLLEFSPEGTELESFAHNHVIGGPQGNALALGDKAKALYVASHHAEVSRASTVQAFSLPPAGPLVREGSLVAEHVRTVSATVTASLDPEGTQTKYRFEYIGEAEYRENVAKGAPGFAGATPAGEGTLTASFAESEVSAALSGLKGETAYRFCLSAENAAKEDGNATCASAEDEATVTTLPVILIEEESAAAVTSTSATLAAQVNPLGNASEYHFEYLTEAQFKADGESFSGPDAPLQAPEPEALLGGVEEPVSVSVHLQGLSPGTVYRYRVIAHNAGGVAAGAVESFTTQGTGSAFALSDGRAWELVSPANKEGAPLQAPITPTDQAAVGGDAVTYSAWWATEADPEGNSNKVTVLSGRGPDGWVSRDLVPAHSTPTGKTTGPQEYQLFSEDLSVGLLQPFGGLNPALSPAASEQTPFLHADFPAGEPGNLCTSSCYLPLVTGCPPAEEACPPAVQASADVAPGTVFGLGPGPGAGGEGCPRDITCGPEFEGASADLRHVFLSYPLAPLLAGAPTESLYEWSAEAPPSQRLQLVSVLPPNAKGEELPASRADLGSGSVLEAFHNGSIHTVHAVSADGSRVVWTVHTPLGRNLYLRDTSTRKTIQLDVPQVLSPGSPQAAFQTASSDDSRILFTDSQHLLPGAGGGEDLYECAITENEGRLHCALSELASGVRGPGHPISSVIASEDGSWVYYFGENDQIFLYHEGHTRPVATLSDEDALDAEYYLPAMTARVSPNGQWLAFMSDRPLTGYDNRDAVSGQLDEELFLYDADADGGAGKLICASCDPTGARPHGVHWSSGLLASGGSDAGWQENAIRPEASWLAASLPGWIPAHGFFGADYQPRYLSDEGRLFFNSWDGLVPGDTNGTADVYQFEPAGVGSCGEGVALGSSVYVPASGGCTSLISSGTSPLESAFLDASESGDDVFFETSAKLVPQDTDDALDVYDAHVCGVGWQCPPPPPPPLPACEGDACQSPASAPEDPTPDSLTFTGPGNLVTASTSPPAKAPTTKKQVKCKRPKKLSHRKCVKPKKKSRAKKASSQRRASR